MTTPMLAALVLASSSCLTAAQDLPPDASADPTTSLDAAFHAWLTAINSGNRAEIQAFYRQHADDPNPLFALEQAEDSCGFAVDHFKAKTSTSMEVLLRQKCLPGLQRLKLAVANAGDSKLKTLDLRPMPLPDNGAIQATRLVADRLAQRGEFAGAIIVEREGKRLFAASWGEVRPGSGRAITLDTPMLLASSGKMFTAVSILQLVAAGKVELDAPIGRYLTEYPNAEMAKVTIRQLLNHRGGAGDIGILGRDEGANRARVRTLAEMIQLNGGRPPEFPPGSKTEYSNYGFILLGAVIERVSGMAYADYVQAHIFAPAGMAHSGFPDRDHLDEVPLGFTRYFGEQEAKVPNTDTLPWRGSAAGGGVASANDMARFFGTLPTGKLLPPELFELATMAGDTPWYGLGFVVNSGPEASWGHGGTAYGMDVAVHHYATINTTFICLGANDMVCNRLIFAWFLRTFPPGDQDD
jgi:CubicO group peptidase (beta-lactamase class C family)